MQGSRGTPCLENAIIFKAPYYKAGLAICNALVQLLDLLVLPYRYYLTAPLEIDFSDRRLEAPNYLLFPAIAGLSM